MTKFVVEILKEINEDVSKAALHRNNQALKFTLEYAFDKNKKFILPEGDPPYKPDAAPLGMSPGNYQQETKRFYVFCRADLAAMRRETLFIQLLEGIHPEEAKMVLAIKDQQLGHMFPNITYEVCRDAGLISIPEENVVVAIPKSEEKPRGKGRPPGSRNKDKTESVDDSGVQETE